MPFGLSVVPRQGKNKSTQVCRSRVLSPEVAAGQERVEGGRVVGVGNLYKKVSLYKPKPEPWREEGLGNGWCCLVGEPALMWPADGSDMEQKQGRPRTGWATSQM